MRYIAIGVYFCLISLVFCKTNVKTLTDSNGQEIIEIDGPKELPPGLEEEPAADSDDDDDALASTISASKKETKKTTLVSSGRRNLKDLEKPDGSAQEDEEAKLEKELAEIYKDSDYKDITEETVVQTITSSTAVPTEDEEKPVARARNSFKFAPDSTNKAAVEKFRTSIDEISCKNREKLSVTSPDTNEPVSLKNLNSSYKLQVSMIIAQLYLVLIAVICI